MSGRPRARARRINQIPVIDSSSAPEASTSRAHRRQNVLLVEAEVDYDRIVAADHEMDEPENEIVAGPSRSKRGRGRGGRRGRGRGGFKYRSKQGLEGEGETDDADGEEEGGPGRKTRNSVSHMEVSMNVEGGNIDDLDENEDAEGEGASKASTE